MIRVLFLLVIATVAMAAAPRGASAADFETAATHAIILDHRSGRVLFRKNPDEPIPTASMSKIMTVYMLLEQLKAGTLTEDDTFVVSEKAWKKGGSKMFVEVGKQVRVGDLLRGIIVQSGNDASIVVAEGLAGSEEAFAERMNEKAQELGLDNTTLRNATGWPDPEHRMSVRDLARLASLTISNFPDYYGLYAEKKFTYHDIEQSNRNPVLYSFDGADGLKTGHTEEAGYGLVAAAERDGQRLIFVLAGMESARERATESVRFMQWAFRTFRNFKLFADGEEVETAEVWLGEKVRVPLVTAEPLALTLSPDMREQMRVEVVYDGPIPAPVKAGEPLAELVVTIPGVETVRQPLLAGSDVARLGPMGRIAAAVGHMIWSAE
ncbi:D-alanyl-D-alanine carboxypeptidase family protein [Minwuia thermotolerans]|nr:D-alanyl-D-alanine carboxypeptidase family protein [Minwuia thermotolerans]